MKLVRANNKYVALLSSILLIYSMNVYWGAFGLIVSLAFVVFLYSSSLSMRFGIIRSLVVMILMVLLVMTIATISDLDQIQSFIYQTKQGVGDFNDWFLNKPYRYLSSIGG
jgi:hypothetical protein